MIIELPPLSVNKIWQGRRYKTKEYDDWIESGLWLLKGQKKQKPPYKIEIEFYMSVREDIDNPIKGLLDLLKKAEIIEDDRFIDELYIKKIKSKNKKIKFNFKPNTLSRGK